MFQVNSKINVCQGQLYKMTHESKVNGCSMEVNVYLPKQYFQNSKKTVTPSVSGKDEPLPTLYYLSGLTCTPQNASEKAFWQSQCDKYGFVIVFPDTSPRGDNIPKDPENGWDFGIGAGFYLNATKEPFNKNYNMYEYVHNELPNMLQDFFQDSNANAPSLKKIDFLNNVGITGHSMGGYGAISGFLKNLNRYKSCSAFSPILNPKNVPWGSKAFNGYLNNSEEWDQYDPCELIKQTEYVKGKDILIHLGTSDPFLKNQLKPELFEDAIKNTEWSKHVKINMVDGFDHSYYFISSFVPEHAKFHAEKLGLI